MTEKEELIDKYIYGKISEEAYINENTKLRARLRVKYRAYGTPKQKTERVARLYEEEVSMLPVRCFENVSSYGGKDIRVCEYSKKDELRKNEISEEIQALFDDDEEFKEYFIAIVKKGLRPKR